PVAAHEVDVLVAVDVEEPAALRAVEELRKTVGKPAGVLVAVHAAGDDGARSRPERLVGGVDVQIGSVHARPGVRSPALIILRQSTRENAGMQSVKPITTETPWYRLEVGEEHWTAEEAALLVRLYEQLLLIRRFEEKLLELHGLGLIHGPAHVSIGQEAGAVGAMSVLGPGDRINGTHRAHHQILAKVLNYATPAGYDPRRDAFTPEMQEMVTRSLAEIMGLTPGFAGGRGGSMHMRYDTAGIPGTSAIIGGNLPHAAGYAFADKVLKTGHISVSFFGDGTLMAGATYEAVDLAALH